MRLRWPAQARAACGPSAPPALPAHRRAEAAQQAGCEAAALSLIRMRHILQPDQHQGAAAALCVHHWQQQQLGPAAVHYPLRRLRCCWWGGQRWAEGMHRRARALCLGGSVPAGRRRCARPTAPEHGSPQHLPGSNHAPTHPQMSAWRRRTAQTPGCCHATARVWRWEPWPGTVGGRRRAAPQAEAAAATAAVWVPGPGLAEPPAGPPSCCRAGGAGMAWCQVSLQAPHAAPVCAALPLPPPPSAARRAPEEQQARAAGAPVEVKGREGFVELHGAHDRAGARVGHHDPRHHAVRPPPPPLVLPRVQLREGQQAARRCQRGLLHQHVPGGRRHHHPAAAAAAAGAGAGQGRCHVHFHSPISALY